MRDMLGGAGVVQSDEDVEMVKMVRVWCGVASWVQASWRGGDEGNSWHDLSLQYPARPAHTRVHFFLHGTQTMAVFFEQLETTSKA